MNMRIILTIAEPSEKFACGIVSKPAVRVVTDWKKAAITFCAGFKLPSEDALFQSMCDTKTPQGVLSVIRMPHYTEEEVMDNGKTPLLMVLEDLQDPGNVGTIIRTAEGAGVTGIIMSRGTADIFNPKTIRSTMGSIYRMPFLIVDDAVGFVKGLKARKICTYAAHLHGVHSYREEDYTKGTAFLIGNEGNGLTDAMAEAAECLIRIPMEGKVESLNAAIASAVLMYEAHGQRA